MVRRMWGKVIPDRPCLILSTMVDVPRDRDPADASRLYHPTHRHARGASLRSLASAQRERAEERGG